MPQNGDMILSNGKDGMCMKKNLLYSFILLTFAVVACAEKEIPVGSGLASEELRLKVLCDQNAISKAFFEDDASGNLSWYGWDDFIIVGIPVETDQATGTQTFHYDKAIPASRVSGWGGGSPSSHFVQYVDKSPFDFYREYQQCVFLMVSSVGVWSEYSLLPATDNNVFSASFMSYAQYLHLSEVNPDLYAFRTAVAGHQRTYCVGNSNQETDYVGYSTHQTICGYSSILSLDDIAGEDYSVIFKGFKPANSLLQFDIRFEGDSDVEMYSMEIRLENSEDHTGKEGWYHVLSGPSFTKITVPDYSASEPGYYEMASIPMLAKRWSVSQDVFKSYLSADETWKNSYFSHLDDYSSRIELSWYKDTSIGDNDRYSFTLSSTPTDYKFRVVVMPQSEWIDEHSYLLFEAKDQQGNVVAIAKKALPTGGFQAGKRYDFTLTLRENDLGTDAGNAGSYGEGTL